MPPRLQKNRVHSGISRDSSENGVQAGWLAERVEFEPSGDLVTVYPHYGAGALISFRANAIAAKLYMSLGFVETGLDDDEFGEPNYKLAGATLDKHR